MAPQNEGVTAEEDRCWSDLPDELLELILSKLPYSDYPYFSSVCKSWSFVTPTVYPASRSPLLLHYKAIQSGICHYYSPALKKTFKVDCPFNLSGYAFYSGKDNWLLVYNDLEIMLVNPFTGIFHQFPGLREKTYFNGAAFSGCPPKDCTIFLISSFVKENVLINIYVQGHWYSRMIFSNNIPFALAPFSNPVCCGGRFYCLGEEGNLGVYDPVEYTWYVAKKFKQFDSSYMNSYLVESRGELIAIQIGNYGTPIRMFRLDQTRVVWEEIQSLGDRSLFVGSKMSLITTPWQEKLRNKVYVPRFHEEPENIPTEVKQVNGQLYFVSKTQPHCLNGKEERKKSKECEICCYSLDNGTSFEYFGSRKKEKQAMCVPLSSSSSLQQYQSQKTNQDASLVSFSMEENQELGNCKALESGRACPWLVFFHGPNKKAKKESQTLFNISERKSYVRNVCELKSYRCWPTPQGWMLIHEPTSGKCYLLDPITLKKVNLPPMDWILSYHAQCVMSSSQVDSKCKLMCVDFLGKSLFFCDREDNKWLRHDLVEEDNLFICLPCAFNGNFYGLTNRWRLVAIEFPPNPKLRILEELPKKLPVGCLVWNEFLLESCGEMFNVRSFYTTTQRHSKMEHVLVLKRNFSDGSWSNVDSIGDRVFFLGVNNFAASCSASQLNIKGNCIHFVMKNDKCLYLFDMEKGTISVHMPCPDLGSNWSTPFWIMPSISV